MSKYIDKKNKKISLLENKCDDYNEEEIRFLISLAKSKNIEHKIIACELLVDSYTIESERILYHLTFDKTYLVKLNAVDSLCIGKMPQSLQRLKQLTYNDDYLIRGYALMSFYDVNVSIYGELPESIESDFQEMCFSEKNNWVKATLYKILYINGNKSYLKKLIELYEESTACNDYNVIWCILNIFEEILDCNNVEDISNCFHSKKHKVLTAQQEKIEELQNKIETFYRECKKSM